MKKSGIEAMSAFVGRFLQLYITYVQTIEEELPNTHAPLPPPPPPPARIGTVCSKSPLPASHEGKKQSEVC